MAREQGKKNGGTKNEEVATRAPQSLALPSFMQGQAGLGTEQIGAADVEIPRLKLLQALSPEVQEGGHRQGSFFHTVTEESLGTELKIVIVYVDQSFILWRPRKTGGGILARALDGVHWTPPNAAFDVVLDDGKTKVTWKTADTVAKSGLAEWGSADPSDPKSPPAATRMYNCVVVMPEHPEVGPAVVTLQRAGVKVARKLMGKLKIAQAPSFGLQFIMSSFHDTNPQNQDFWNYKFTADGFVADEKDFNAYKALYENFKKLGVKVRDVEGLQQDDTPAETTSGAGSTQGEKY